jgi:organic radical activating enzyme
VPAASISNGHTGELCNASADVVRSFVSLVGSCRVDSDPREVSRQTLGRELHVVEFWMPGGCNLRCSHCYVADWSRARRSMTTAEYEQLARRMTTWGLKDVVVPGMEPLLRDETWAVVRAAADAGARSIGLTTNATLLSRRIGKVLDSALTVLNVSLDGPQPIHDQMRGKGVFRIAMRGVAALRAQSALKVISNCTVNLNNQRALVDVAKVAADHALAFAAFHPFERSADIDNGQALGAAATADSFETLLAAFDDGQTGSLVLETEASNLDVLLELNERGWFRDMDLLQDETGFLFFAKRKGPNLLLVNLMAYPHHFIRTLRVSDDGGLSSCRGMAINGWQGLGDLRVESPQHLLRTNAAIDALAYIWGEFQQSLRRAPEGALDRFIATVQKKAIGTRPATRAPKSLEEFEPLEV